MSFERDDLGQIDFALVQTQLLVPTVQSYINDHIEELAFDHIVPEIQGISLAMNIPRQFAEGVKAMRSGPNRVRIINTWGDRNKPLAKWFNYGTRDHGPRFAKFLHWKDKKTGRDIFAKWVRGIPRTNAMETGIELGKKRFIDSLLLQARYEVSRELKLNVSG